MFKSVTIICRLFSLCFLCSLVDTQPTVQEFYWEETCHRSRDHKFKEALDFILIEMQRQRHENRQLRSDIEELKQKSAEHRLLLVQLSDSVTLLVHKLLNKTNTCSCPQGEPNQISLPDPRDTVLLGNKGVTGVHIQPQSDVTVINTTTTALPTSPTTTTTTLDPLLDIYNGSSPKDCKDISDLGYTENGTYQIRPNGSMEHFPVFCEFQENGVWTVFQRRVDGSVDFFRNWAEYKNGFGNLTKEFWLGNEKIFHLTNQATYKLGIDMWDWANEKGDVDSSKHYFSESSFFYIDNETKHYELHVPNDYFAFSGFGGSGLRVHSGPFLTYDKVAPRMHGNCAVKFHCGWWFSTCVRNANFNGRYYQDGYKDPISKTRAADDIYWPNIEQSLKKVVLKLQRTNETDVYKDVFALE